MCDKANPSAAAILKTNFHETVGHQCNCGCQSCPRRWLAVSGFVVGGFLLPHLTLNAIAVWPAAFQRAVGWASGLRAALPELEIALIFVPLGFHVALGLRTLWREKLKYGVTKHHHGSDLRYWLQRVTAAILVAFLLFHLPAMHWRFDQRDAFRSASQGMWQFWGNLPSGHPVNLLVTQFYLLGMMAAIYHLANGVATGAEVLGFSAQKRLQRVCVAGALALLVAGFTAWYALKP